MNCGARVRYSIGRVIISKDSLNTRIEWDGDVTGYCISPCDDSIVFVCGAECCNSVPLTKSEAERFKDCSELKGFRHYLGEVDYHCLFLSHDSKCLVYDERPLLCRVYPFGLNEPVINDGVVVFSVDNPRGCHTKVSKVFSDSSLSERLRAEELNNDLVKLALELFKDLRKEKRL